MNVSKSALASFSALARVNFSTSLATVSVSLAAVLASACLSFSSFFSASRTKAHPSLVGCWPCFSSSSLCAVLNGRPLPILIPPNASSTSAAVSRSSAGVPSSIGLVMGDIVLRVLRGGRPWASRRALSCSALISSIVRVRLSERGSNDGGRSYVSNRVSPRPGPIWGVSPTITAAPSEGMSAVAIPAISAAAASSAASLDVTLL